MICIAPRLPLEAHRSTGLTMKRVADKPGFYKGKHATAYVEQVQALKRAKQFDEAEWLLLDLVDATEAENQVEQQGAAPWYYEQLAIIYRGQNKYAAEVAILERCKRQPHRRGTFLYADRLVKARSLLRESTGPVATQRFLTGIIWLFATLISASIAIPLGLLVAVLGFAVSGVLLFFIWFTGISLVIGGALGGAMVGWLIGTVHYAVLHRQLSSPRPVLYTSMAIWAVAGIVCHNEAGPISNGDIAPLFPILLKAAVVAGIGQWIILLFLRVPGAMWRGSSGTVAVVGGTLVGLLLTGSFLGRQPDNIFAGAAADYESIRRVQVESLVELNGDVLVFVSVESANLTHRRELWRVTGGGTAIQHVQTVYTGWDDPGVVPLAAIRSQLYFRATGVEQRSAAHSYLQKTGLWVTDGTAEGTHTTSDSEPAGPKPNMSTWWSDKAPTLQVGTTSYFVVSKNERSVELWRAGSGSTPSELIKTFS
jgi:hypothetical protein